MSPIGDVMAVGARGPLGLSSLQLALCARAKKLEPRSLPHLLDKRGREIGMCVSGGLSWRLYGYDRLLALAVPALTEACAEVLPALGIESPVAVVLSLPEAGRADDDERLGAPFVADLAERSDLSLDVDGSRFVRCGHAGGAYALELAAELLVAGAPAVVVGGVDSYLHPEVLAALDADYRLHALDAVDGFIPSEGAAFALLARSNAQERKKASGKETHEAPLARVMLSLSGLEPSVGSEQPNLATMSTELMNGLVSAVGEPGWVLSDINGERHRVREWSLVEIRQQLPEELVHDRFVGNLGDLGAASGATLLAIACEYWRSGCAPASLAAVALFSEGPERGVFAIREVQR